VNRYELLHEADQQHHHMHCRGCGAELPLEAEPIDALKAEIARRSGFRAELDHLYINGICAACASHTEENRR
jgi:Fe2+ or Zn2+ uptake regulation protein